MATERIRFNTREEWLAGRDAQGFGGSDAPAIAGCGFISTLELWRQKTGRLSQYLSKEASQVSRIFCGLEQRLK